MTEKEKNARKTKDERFEAVVVGVVEKALDAAKVVAKVGIKGAFRAKDLSGKVDGGEAEKQVKAGVAEVEKAVQAGLRTVKTLFKNFLDELAPDEDPDKKT